MIKKINQKDIGVHTAVTPCYASQTVGFFCADCNYRQQQKAAKK